MNLNSLLLLGALLTGRVAQPRLSPPRTSVPRAALEAGREKYAWDYGKRGEGRFLARVRDGEDEASSVFTLP